MNPYRLIITDDHYAFREVLKILLEKKEDLEVVGEASDGGELVKLLSSGDSLPDLIILDISMSVMTGLEAAPIIKKRFPKVRILILSHHDQKELVEEAASIGVDGYVTKDDLAANLFCAIDAIRQGGTYFSGRMTGRC
jgi:DNA-binding NarL/FixJ family response regulator